jgi:hypothetical protein
MLNGILKPHGIRTTYFNINSTMDIQWETAAHNPANFQIVLPNSTRTNRVWRIAVNTLTVPRMFPTIYAPDNVIVWYQRQVLEIPTGAPDTYLRTVDQKWTETKRLEFPSGLWNQTRILDHINAFTGPNEVWTFDASSQSFVFVVTPTDPPVVWGEFVDPGHVPPPVSYANMTYIGEPLNTHIFDPLGLEKSASFLSTLPLSPTLDPFDPDTFDNLKGSNLDSRNVYPQFDRLSHSYATWSAAVFMSPPNNVPNLSGPTTVHLSVTDLGDSSTVDAQSGTSMDILATMNLGDVDFGTFKSRDIADVEGEAVEFQQARNIANFRVSILDARNRQLVLPRNFPVFLKLQLVHSTD